MKTTLQTTIAIAILAIASSAYATSEHDNPQTPVKGPVGPQATAGAFAGSFSGASSNQNQTQQQQQLSQQSQNVTVSNGNGNGGDWNGRRYPAATAYAPSIQPTAPCTVPYGVGVQGYPGGISIGGAKIAPVCQTQEVAKTSAGFGDIQTAEEVMCSIDEYRFARDRTKRPCVKIEADPDSKVYTGRDNTVRQRVGQPLIYKEDTAEFGGNYDN